MADAAIDGQILSHEDHPDHSNQFARRKEFYAEPTGRDELDGFGSTIRIQ
jgi:hypothetical protein